MIRQATEADIPRLIEMGLQFVAQTSYKDRIVIDPEKLAETIRLLLANPAGTILVAEKDGAVKGMIAMASHSHPFSGETIACEVVWWVDPDARGDGIRLLKAAEDWGRDIGAKRIQMIAPDLRVAQTYERLGYELIESSFQRSL